MGFSRTELCGRVQVSMALLAARFRNPLSWQNTGLPPVGSPSRPMSAAWYRVALVAAGH
jgi:hypothetical protein